MTSRSLRNAIAAVSLVSVLAPLTLLGCNSERPSPGPLPVDKRTTLVDDIKRTHDELTAASDALNAEVLACRKPLEAAVAKLPERGTLKNQRPKSPKELAETPRYVSSISDWGVTSDLIGPPSCARKDSSFPATLESSWEYQELEKLETLLQTEKQKLAELRSQKQSFETPKRIVIASESCDEKAVELYSGGAFGAASLMGYECQRDVVWVNVVDGAIVATATARGRGIPKAAPDSLDEISLAELNKNSKAAAQREAQEKVEKILEQWGRVTAGR